MIKIKTIVEITGGDCKGKIKARICKDTTKRT